VTKEYSLSWSTHPRTLPGDSAGSNLKFPSKAAILYSLLNFEVGDILTINALNSILDP